MKKEFEEIMQLMVDTVEEIITNQQLLESDSLSKGLNETIKESYNRLNNIFHILSNKIKNFINEYEIVYKDVNNLFVVLEKETNILWFFRPNEKVKQYKLVKLNLTFILSYPKFSISHAEYIWQNPITLTQYYKVDYTYGNKKSTCIIGKYSNNISMFELSEI